MVTPARRPDLQALGAHVSGWAAFAIDCILRTKAEPYLAAMQPWQREQVKQAQRAIHAAALHWQSAISSDGSTEPPPAEAVSLSEPWMSTADAATKLGVSERRVCQLANGWAEHRLARKLGRQWLVDRELCASTDAAEVRGSVTSQSEQRARAQLEAHARRLEDEARQMKIRTRPSTPEYPTAVALRKAS